MGAFLIVLGLAVGLYGGMAKLLKVEGSATWSSWLIWFGSASFLVGLAILLIFKPKKKRIGLEEHPQTNNSGEQSTETVSLNTSTIETQKYVDVGNPPISTKVFAALECLYQHEKTIIIGDLFLTNTGLFYVPLTEVPELSMSSFLLSKEGHIFSGALAGGLVGALVGSMSNAETVEDQKRNTFDSALDYGRRVHRGQYGMSLQERIDNNTRKDLSIVIQREDVAKLIINNSLLKCETTEGKSFQFTIVATPASILRDIEKYPGMVQYLDEKSDYPWLGLNIPYPAPLRLIASLQKGDRYSSATINNMLQDMRYIEVCYFYLTQLRGKVLETVCRNIAENSSMLSKVMANMSYVSRQQNPIPKWSISIKPEDYDTGTELLSWCNKRAAFLNSQNRQQEAIGLYETILATNRKCVDAWNGKGNALISADTNAADSCFAQALKYNPKSTEALHGRGAVIVKLQQFSKSKLEKALGYFDEVLELNPESLNTLYLKAIVILHLGQLDESIKYLDKILDVSPDNGPAWDIKGDTLCKLKRFDEALKCYDEVDRIFPDSRWTKKANILYNLERFKEALRCYTAATRINPYSSDDWYNKALTEDKLDFTEQAILSFEHWLSFNLQSPAAVQKKKYAHNRINELNRKRRSVVD